MTTTPAATAVCRRPAAVIGGSLGGLAAAHALQQTGAWHVVDVYERSAGPLDTKGSGLGFVHVPAWEGLTGRPMIRQGRRANRAQGSFYYGDLWKYLYQGLLDYNRNNSSKVVVHFGKTISELQQRQRKQPPHEDAVWVDGQPYNLVVVCDGGFSSLRKSVLGNEPDGAAEPKYAGYVVWRGSIPVQDLPHDFDIEEGVYKNGIYDTIVLKMAKDNGEDLWTMGSFIATPEEEIQQYWNKDRNGKNRQDVDGNHSVPDWFLPHFEMHFSHVPGLVPLIRYMMTKGGEITPHAQFEFGASQVHRGRVVLLGDAAHMASPRTAVGAHTAILDALALRQTLMKRCRHVGSTDNVEECLALYSTSGGGVERAQELYNRTREVSKQFVQPGC
eukprot:scaffold301_cov150-Amphora_coffeaeformis.AAC.4